MPTDYARAEASYLCEPDPRDYDDYCEDCQGAPCVCDAAYDLHMDPEAL